jgi:adenine-specific DNA-methyltransferase
VVKFRKCSGFKGEACPTGWYVNPERPEEAPNDFKAIGEEPGGMEKHKRLPVELLDKNQLYVNLSEMDDEMFQVSEADKVLNRAFYGPM